MDLVEQLRSPPEYPSKSACPLLKLATFGQLRSDKGKSFRHDGNVVEIFGVEGDHDDETVTPAEAARRLNAAGVRALVYTSASHGVVGKKSRGGPRWRVLAPLSRAYSPGERDRFVDQLNGVLGGVLSMESWTLSQPFYYGRVAGAPYEFRETEGLCIDELELVLAVEPIGKPGGRTNPESIAPQEVPELRSETLTPKWSKLGLPKRAELFLAGDYQGPDRSGELQYVTKTLYETLAARDHELHDEVVFSVLAHNAAAMAVALDHRRGDEAQALDYLWRHHCLKAHADVEKRLALADAFSDLTGEGPKPADPLHAFHAYLPQHLYIHRVTCQLFPASSIDGHLRGAAPDGMKSSAWLDRERAVHQMTWDPNHGEVVADRIVADGGWIESPGQKVYNTYRPPLIRRGEAGSAGPWLEHLRRLFPEEHEHLLRWFAHRVQRPGEKINHALVLGGKQGVGKDTLLEPVKDAVGRWNWGEVSPAQMLEAFNDWARSVVLRVSEARDLGDIDRFKFYDHSKTYIAAPPDVLRVNEKHRRQYPVLNVMGVIITTNHRTDGIYLPEDDRRHFVAWSPCAKEDFDEGYWNRLWGWLNADGYGHVGAYLREVDLSAFDAKAPPPRTTAFHAIVMAGQDPEDGDLSGVLEALGRPAAVTVDEVREAADRLDGLGSALVSLTGPRNARKIAHMMDRAGYEPIRNPGEGTGRWSVGGKKCVVYGRTDLQLRERLAALRAKYGPKA